VRISRSIREKYGGFLKEDEEEGEEKGRTLED
jgi:hypothetical protein